MKVFGDVGLGVDVDALEDAGLRPHKHVEVDGGRRHAGDGDDGLDGRIINFT